MANRTIKSKYAAQDVARSTQREILSFEQNKDKIYYNLEEHPQSSSNHTDQLSIFSSSEGSAKTTREVPARQPPTASVSMNSVAVPEASVPAEDVIRTFIAQKLKKNFEDISMSSSITALSEGKFVYFDD